MPTETNEATYPCHRRMALADLGEYPNNPRTVTPEAMAQLRVQLDELGNLQPITFNVRTGRVVSGNQRLKIYAKRGDQETDVWCVDLPEEKERVAVIALNNHAGEFDLENLKALTEAIAAGETGESALSLVGFKAGELESLLSTTTGTSATAQSNQRQEAHKTLASRFLLPPFSVLDARQGYWQERKAAWIALGLKGELGRGQNLLKMSDTVLQPDPAKRLNVASGSGSKGALRIAPVKSAGAMPGSAHPGANSAYLGRMPDGGKMVAAKEAQQRVALQGGANARAIDTEGNIAGEWTGTSIFDPVLAEAICYWFCPPGGKVLDPFAGGVTRGAVAACTGHPYFGCDLSEAQIAANREQWPTIKSPYTTPEGGAEPPDPVWVAGDARNLEAHFIDHGPFDLIFSCPPYANLERYSDDERDISALDDYAQFMEEYAAIIRRSVEMLKPNRFAVFVVGEVRDKKNGGFYLNLVSDTISAFEAADAHFYNEAILVTAIGTLPIRVARHFASARKLGKTHQNVLVFFKGDPENIRREFPALEPPTEMPQPQGAAAQLAGIAGANGNGEHPSAHPSAPAKEEQLTIGGEI